MPNGGKPSICFVALNAYGLLSGRSDIQHIGGAEVQQSLIAHELVKRGYRVSFVTLDHGQPDGDVVDGITVYKAYRRDAGIPKLRFVHPRTTRLHAALKRADADIYYQRGAGIETGLVTHWCRRRGRPFVFGAASDLNFEPTLLMLPTASERVLFRYGVRGADAVIVQSEQQRIACQARFGRSSFVVPSAVRIPETDPRADLAAATGPPRVLWIGRLHPEKRPEWLLDLVEASPAVAFDAIGECNVGSEYARRLIERMSSLPNVTHHDYVPHANMTDVYRRASVVLCTSPLEGFSNTLLEAWACGLPALSTVDPDGIIAKFGLGCVSPDFSGLAEGLNRLAADHAFRRLCGDRARDYVQRHHAPSTIGDALQAVFDVVLAGAMGESLSSLATTGRGDERFSFSRT